ncbi:MAG: hypothetical protein HYT09_00025 [Candidatus Levybacteria bacterium]|nr:hypothetical protein [Candidatus Levybacteria bacterium]
MNYTKKGFEKLSQQEKNEVISDLIYAFVNCKTVREAALFLQDILTRSELQLLSRRLRIAKLLLEGKTYESIEKSLHVSHTTVAKVAIWLADKGDGFRNIIKTLPKNKDSKDPLSYDFRNFKRRHAMYFWPELIIEEIIKNANKKQKERLRKSVASLDKSLIEKNKLHRELEKLLYPKSFQ